MNPFDHWYDVNPELRELLEESRKQAARINVDESLRVPLELSLGIGSTMVEKLLAVTVVTMHSLYFESAEEQSCL